MHLPVQMLHAEFITGGGEQVEAVELEMTFDTRYAFPTLRISSVRALLPAPYSREK